MADWRAALDGCIEDMAADLRATRRHLHAHPEPSREEFRTAEYLAGRLDADGIPARLVPSRRGVIAGPETSGPRVAIRGDIDALRIQDVKDVSYRSTVDGVMHACGHDAHATMALGAARTLWRCRDALPGPVAWRVILQPAEEVGEGAFEMVEAGAVDGVAAIVALHVDPDLKVGRVAQRPGTLTASCADLRVTVRGVGGHAARPHLTTDPVAAAAMFVTAVYQSVPRSVDPREATVVTFGAIHGGSSPNVIPDRVELLGTIRATSRAAAEGVEARLRRVARGLAEATGNEIEIVIDGAVAAVVNDPAVTAVCARAAGEVVGADRVDPIPLPSLGGEDFAAYLAHVPGCMLRLGVASGDRPKCSLHSPHFDIDERALVLGVKILARSVVLLAAEGRVP